MRATDEQMTRRVRRGHGLPYVAALDGIRAVAVAGVVLYHAGARWLPGGFLGVDLFFVLSGFLITSLLLAEREATGRIDLPAFWARRARRLLPAAFLVIALAVLAVAILSPSDLPSTRADAIASFLYVNNWHQILADQSYFQAFARPSLLRHLWSLAVEEQFYLLWPLVMGICVAALGRRRTTIVTLVLAIASSGLMAVLFTPGRDPSRVYYGTDTHATGLLIGALLAFAWPLSREAARRTRVTALDAAGTVALAVLLVAMLTWNDYQPTVYQGGLAAVAVVTAVLVGAVTHGATRLGAVLGAQPLRWIGERSYGIYLWHWPVMALTRPGIDLTWPATVVAAAQIAVTLLLAAASYRWVEMPIRNRTGFPAVRGWLDRRPPRGRLAIVASLVAAAVVAVAFVTLRDTPVQAAAPIKARATPAAKIAPASTTPATTRSRPRRPLGVGASVMLAAQPALRRVVKVDAAVGRQAPDILDRLRSYRSAGDLPTSVAVQLGENGPITDADMTRLRRLLQGVDRVVLVNVRIPRSWGDAANDVLADAAKGWPQARIADWHAASAVRGVLYPDGTHPTPAGQEVYARLVERALAAR